MLCMGIFINQEIKSDTLKFYKITNTLIDVPTDKQLDKQTHFKKIPKTTSGPTRILCVNLSSIGSVVLEKVKKNVFFMYHLRKSGQTERQRENCVKKVAHDTRRTNQDVVCEFHLNRFGSFFLAN